MHGLDDLPAEWKQYIHVDGKPYFQHLTWRVVTEAFVRDLAVRAQLEEWYHQIDSVRLQKASTLNISDNWELYLTLDPQPGYYFVDHGNQSIFWLSDAPLEQLGIGRSDLGSFGETRLSKLPNVQLLINYCRNIHRTELLSPLGELSYS